MSGELASGGKPVGGSARSSPVRVGLFSLSGEYWTIGLDASRFILKNIKGLGYLQRLLQHPDREFHALDLLSGAGAGSARSDTLVGPEETLPVGITIRRGLSGDAGETLDAQAKREYQRRLHELNESLEDQRERGNHERADQIEGEVEFLTRTIERASGLGGRQRRTGSNAERARLSVTSAIKTAFEKISEQDKELWNFLDRSIRTGSFCRYVPDPESPITWQFSTDGVSARRDIRPTLVTRSSRDTNFLRAFTEGTAFVGRTTEYTALLRALDQMQRGDGKIVVIRGSPGVGKTRIAAEIAAEASRRGVLRFVGGCYDRDEPVPFLPFIEIVETALAQTGDLPVFREMLGADASEIARLVPQLRRSFPDIPAPSDLPPEQSRKILFDAVSELLDRLSRSTPSLFIFDDLQWADDESLLLLNHLAKLIPSLPAMIIGTLREFEPDRAVQLNRTLDELIRGHLVESISLSGLSESSVAQMLHALGGHEPPQEVVRLFYAHTEGNPFFVEELFRHLCEQGRLIGSEGEFRQDLRLSEPEVPQTVRVVISRRLARLSAGALKTLGMAAVIGRSFPFDLLVGATKMDTDSVLDCLEEAEVAGLITSTLEYPEARFRFSHELTRQTAIGRLSVARRQRLHLDIANAIERLYAQSLEGWVNELAHHLFQAGTAAEGARTANYVAMAARRAVEQGALAEAEIFYRRAIDVLETTGETPERYRQELELLLSLGATYIATRGYAAVETAATFDRAAALGERLGEPIQVVLALSGQFALPLLHGKIEIARAFANRIRAVADRCQSKVAHSVARHFQGCSNYHAGALDEAREYLSDSITMYVEEDSRALGRPLDQGHEALCYLAVTEWQRGMLDTARVRIKEAGALAVRLHMPYVLAYQQYFEGHLSALLRDVHGCQRLAEAGLEQITNQPLPLFFHILRILRGWALARQGRCEEGVSLAHEGLMGFKAGGYGLSVGLYHGFLAETLFLSNSLAEASAMVEEGILAVGDQLVDLPYLLWLRGEFLAREAQISVAARDFPDRETTLESAEASFRKSISVANRMRAKTMALRAATSLARLLIAEGRSGEARDVVAPILGEFTEGFDTRDLVEAKEIAR